MRPRAVAIAGLVAAMFGAVRVAGQAPGIERKGTPPERAMPSWQSSYVLPRAQVDREALREEHEAAAWALLEGYVPPSGLAEESREPRVLDEWLRMSRGFGSGHGRLGGAHRHAPPIIRFGEPTVDGGLDRAVVGAVLRQAHGLVRLCYEKGLRNNPNLQGRITVRFVVDARGSPMQLNSSSDLPDGTVIRCVVDSMTLFGFPASEHGTDKVHATVTLYPGG